MLSRIIGSSNVGWEVGEIVGTSVGCNDTDGKRVGLGLGATEGFGESLGPSVGLAVATTGASLLGEIVGAINGSGEATGRLVAGANVGGAVVSAISFIDISGRESSAAGVSIATATIITGASVGICARAIDVGPTNNRESIAKYKHNDSSGRWYAKKLNDVFFAPLRFTWHVTSSPSASIFSIVMGRDAGRPIAEGDDSQCTEDPETLESANSFRRCIRVGWFLFLVLFNPCVEMSNWTPDVSSCPNLSFVLTG